MGKYFEKLQKGELEEVIKNKKVESEMEEGNAFTGALAKAKEAGKDEFKFNGKTYKVKESETKESVRMTEDELVSFIEEIVNEQKGTPGITAYKKHQKDSGKENKDYMKMLEKKMKDYLKDASKGKFEMNPTMFPAGNGELGEMKKKAYTPSGAVEEYIENFAYSPGMENLQYDEIQPNEDWLEANIEGSSKTGNSPKYANAVDTGLGKKINAKRKKNLYGVEKNRSYNRYTQPVDNAGEVKGSDKLNNIFSKLGESEDKKQNVISEEVMKMKDLISYNKKTQ
jgi:hypothetical protein